MLTKRQQQVLRDMQMDGCAVKTHGNRHWSTALSRDGRFRASASTIYALVDAELAATGPGNSGCDVAALTAEGEEWCELVAATLSKRQQEMLCEILTCECGNFAIESGNGLWFVWDHEYSANTVYALSDVGLLGFVIEDGDLVEGCRFVGVAALTPAGHRVAEILTRSAS